MKEGLSARERDSTGQRCPYCHDDVARSAAAVACLGCGSLHHRECFEERGACSVFCCPGEKASEVALAGTLLRAYRESHERARGYETSLGFSILLLFLCIFSGGGLLLALATNVIYGLIPAVVLVVLLPVIYATTRSVALGVSLARGATGDETPTRSARSRG